MMQSDSKAIKPKRKLERKPQFRLHELQGENPIVCGTSVHFSTPRSNTPRNAPYIPQSPDQTALANFIKRIGDTFSELKWGGTHLVIHKAFPLIYRDALHQEVKASSCLIGISDHSKCFIEGSSYEVEFVLNKGLFFYSLCPTDEINITLQKYNKSLGIKERVSKGLRMLEEGKIVPLKEVCWLEKVLQTHKLWKISLGMDDGIILKYQCLVSVAKCDGFLRVLSTKNSLGSLNRDISITLFMYINIDEIVLSRDKDGETGKNSLNI